ncbi:hypothetical protein HPP92_005626 [Vanilla planifolia]|uniref:Uncharacterized protein n=1 Tax=Vanilla planifolia TaxID=51239 RepID=A0A835RU85_VANPL|nr:hypothetical protein HPP92_005626 [Vanilla planifolia]
MLGYWDDLVRTACQQALQHDYDGRKLTSEGEIPHLSHDAEGFSFRLDQKLLREKMEHLSGSESSTDGFLLCWIQGRSFLKQRISGTPLIGHVAHISPYDYGKVKETMEQHSGTELWNLWRKLSDYVPLIELVKEVQSELRRNVSSKLGSKIFMTALMLIFYQNLKKEISMARIQMVEPIIKGRLLVIAMVHPSDAAKALCRNKVWLSSLSDIAIEEWNEYVDSYSLLQRLL